MLSTVVLRVSISIEISRIEKKGDARGRQEVIEGELEASHPYG